MKILRIAPNIAAKEHRERQEIHEGILGLQIAMDNGWIATFEAESSMLPQLSVAAHGGSATDVPDLTIEVDDLDEVLLEAFNIAYDDTHGQPPLSKDALQHLDAA
jgi:hypothetical protein